MGFCRHFHVSLDGQVRRQGDDFLLTGVLLRGWAVDAAPVCEGPAVKVLVRMRASDYYAVGKHSEKVRILHSTLTHEPEQRVIDATYGSTVVAGLTHIRRDETVAMAELFSGSFNGWSQAAYVLHDMGYDVKVRWLLDQDPACATSAGLSHDACLHVVTNEGELRSALTSSGDVFAVASLEHAWWHSLCALPGTVVWAASPPCPPWSMASWGPGLESQDGQLVLHLLALLEVYQVPCLVLEQVAGFRAQKHFPEIKNAWEAIGYRQVWEKVWDLAEIAPGSRPRYLTVLMRQDVPGRCLQWHPPTLPVRPTLDSFQCVAQLPPDLLAPCVLAQYRVASFRACQVGNPGPTSVVPPRYPLP